MKIHSRLLLAGALAGVVASAAPAAAQPEMLRVKNPAGQMMLEFESDVPFADDYLIGALDITRGFIEIQAGPVDANGRKHFILTRANLRFADFDIMARKLGDTPVRFEHVGMDLIGTTTWASHQNGIQLPTGMGVYPIFIKAGGGLDTSRDAVFALGARISDSYFEGDPKIDRQAFLYVAGTVDPALGYPEPPPVPPATTVTPPQISLQHGKVKMRFVFKASTGGFFSSDIIATLTLTGDIDGYGENKTPEMPPTEPTEGGLGRPPGKPGKPPVILHIP